MQSIKRIQPSLVVSLLLLVTFLLYPTGDATAGIYDADQETAYREFWVPHTAANFSGGFQPDPNDPAYAAAGCLPIYDYGWFVEPWPVITQGGERCAKTVEFSIPDSLQGAQRAEIYLDLWRNHAAPQVSFELNDGVKRTPDLGDDWSRNGWVGEIPLSELRQGTNTMRVTSAGNGLHIHDIAIRVYYDAAAISAPAGTLKSVSAGGATFQPPTNGGVLDVNSNQVTLTASVTSANVKFVEFHAYYEGYDEDNNRLLRDWHNRGRHDWHPGGREPKATGGTIDHIGTVAVGGPGDYSITWNMAHIHNQAGVKFKIRLVSAAPGNDSAYVVRDAAGGVSGDFTLKRNRAVMTFYNPFFFDNVLCHRDLNDRQDCRYDEIWTTILDIPVDVTQFGQAYFLGAYWDNPFVKINAGSEFAGSAGLDWWALGVQPRPIGEFRTGANTIQYRYNSGANYFGQFVEKPGPFAVLAQTSASGDGAAPQIFDRSPFPGQGGVAVDSTIRIVLSEIRNQIGHGIDLTSIKLTVNGEVVTPQISGFANEYTLRYQPAQPFDPNSTVTVTLEACDIAGNCLEDISYQFFTQDNDSPLNALSDDFNACTVDETRWRWVDPLAGTNAASSYDITGTHVVIDVPGGIGHDLWVGANHAPRLLQTVNNVANFEVLAKFDSVLDAATQMQGLIFQQDDDTLLRIDFEVRAGATPGIYLFAAALDGATAQEKRTALVAAGNYEGALTLRVRRANTVSWQIAYRLGEGNWIELSPFTHSININSAGVFAGNAGSNPAFTAQIDYFVNGADSLGMNDPIILSADHPAVTVSPADAGTVAGSPDCGSPLALTATPSAGWRFDRWEIAGPGSEVSTDNPLVRAFAAAQTATAVFERDGFVLDVDVINQGSGAGGTVTFDPDRSVYAPGETVALTAVTPLGWTFDGWGGDLSGNEPLKTLSMSDNVDATATFSQDRYALTVDVMGSGNGLVTLDGLPIGTPPAVYDDLLYGDEVTLRATAALDGSRFAGWSGNLPPDADPAAETLTLMLTGDTGVAATFVADSAYVLLRIVEPREEAGIIEAAPDRAEFAVGETVQLTAVPADGWLFLGWGGSLSGNTNPLPVTITADTQAIARFVAAPNGNRLYLPIVERE